MIKIFITALEGINSNLLSILKIPVFSKLVSYIANKLRKQNWVLNGTVDNEFKDDKVTSASNIKLFITNLSNETNSFKLNKIIISFGKELKIKYLNNSIGSKNDIERLYTNLPTIQAMSVQNALKPYDKDEIILEKEEISLLVKKASDEFTDESSEFSSALSKYYVEHSELIDKAINDNSEYIKGLMNFYNKHINELKYFVNNYKYNNEISYAANILMNKILNSKDVRDQLKLCFQIEFIFEINNYSKVQSSLYHNKYNSIKFGGTFDVKKLSTKTY